MSLGFNKLSDGPACVAVVDPDWAITQTVPPTGLQATVQSPNQVRLAPGAYPVYWRWGVLRNQLCD